MKLFKNWIFLGMLLSIGGSIFGYLFNNSYQFGICFADEVNQIFAAGCNYTFSTVGAQIFYPSLSLVFVFLILLFLPQTVRAWRAFALWYIPVFVILMAIPPSKAGWDIGPSKGEGGLILGGLYVGISVGIIGVALLNQKLKQRGNKKLSIFWYWLSGSALGIIAILIVSPYMRSVFELLLLG